MSTPNPKNLSPLPNFPERGRVEVDRIIATPKSNALGERAGERYAEEGIWEDYAAPFFESQTDARSGASHQSIDAVLAGQADGRGRLGSGQEIPAFDAVDDRIKAGFVQAVSGSEQSANPGVFPHFPRRGFNSNTLAPTAGFSAGRERPGTIYATSRAPANGGRGRVNIADVTEV